ncbi:hypothetical protein OIU78_024968 [Salix suchowensis]|nr:hypothetical protein OIU78_024968 [Salix suchowensis]
MQDLQKVMMMIQPGVPLLVKHGVLPWQIVQMDHKEGFSVFHFPGVS